MNADSSSFRASEVFYRPSSANDKAVDAGFEIYIYIFMLHMILVSVKDALAYCDWLSYKTNKKYRLPKQAEWEKSARFTDGRIYPWGNKFDSSFCNINIPSF